MKIIQLTQNKIALVDDSDYDDLNKYKWRAINTNGKNWYAIRSAIGKGNWKENIYMHRQIMNIENNFQIDHINNDGLDNRRENLRVCTLKENQHNQRISSRNTTGYKGVHKCRNKGLVSDKWTASIKSKYIGMFDSPIKAALAYDNMAIKLFGEFAKTNKSLGLL